MVAKLLRPEKDPNDLASPVCLVQKNTMLTKRG